MSEASLAKAVETAKAGNKAVANDAMTVDWYVFTLLCDCICVIQCLSFSNGKPILKLSEECKVKLQSIQTTIFHNDVCLPN